MIVTEQYTKGLGPTVQEICECMGDSYHPYEKLTFSGICTEEINAAVKALGKKNILVCVLQSVIDLKAEGFNVLLVEDCIASRKPKDKDIAVKRAMGEGAFITSAEAALFELTCKNPPSKAFTARKTCSLSSRKSICISNPSCNTCRILLTMTSVTSDETPNTAVGRYSVPPTARICPTRMQ